VSGRDPGPFPVAVRWRDLDALGHVNSAVFATYFEEVREAWLLEALEGAIKRDEIVVARIEIDYLRPVDLDLGELLGTVRLIEFGTKRLVTAEELAGPDGTAVARARTTLVLWDARRSETTELTAGQRDRLTELRRSE
jgi:acyl-CoA thioester hydrolase